MRTHREKMLAEFEQFHHDNPRVYEMFKEFTWMVIRRGRKRWSARDILHRIRWETNVVIDDPSGFKISDHHSPFYARMFMHEFPQYDGFFSIKEAAADLMDLDDADDDADADDDPDVDPDDDGVALGDHEEEGGEVGFFDRPNGRDTTTAEGEELRPRTRTTRRSASDGPRGCDHCPLNADRDKLKSPRMPVDGPAAADILVIGEAPGEDEDRQGRPFVGNAGKLLRQYLPRRHGERLALTNAVRCRPTAGRSNRAPTVAELHACSLHLEASVTGNRYKAILGLGGVPLSRVLTGATITQVHGLRFPVQIGTRVLWYYPAFHPSFILRSGGDDPRAPAPSLPLLENDLREFFRTVDQWPDPVIERPDPNAVICVTSEQQARGYLAKMTDPLGLDIETNDLRPNTHKSEIMTAAVSDGSTTMAWPVRHPRGANGWGLPLLLEAARERRWIAHNAGFELAWLREHAKRYHAAPRGAGAAAPAAWCADWRPAAGFDDSMAAARLYQRRESCLNLGILTRLYCGTDIKTLSTIDTNNISGENLDDVLKYNGLDAWGSWRIFMQLWPQIDDANYQALLATIQSVTEMHLVGLDIDQAAANQLHDHWQQRAAAAAAHAATVYEAKQYVEQEHREFSIGSPAQVGEALVKYGRVRLPKNRDGTYKTDEHTLTTCCPDNPLALDVLAYRHANKLDETYCQAYIQAPGKYPDRRIHPVYSTCLTRTYRLSAEDPSIQNFPKRRDHELRRPVVPPAGCIWAAADFGQLEARVYAMASRDQELTRSIIEGRDIHSYWLDQILDRYPPYAERLRQKTGSDDRKAWRDVIKADFVFSSFYGSTARNVTDRTGIPQDIATTVLGDFWDQFSGAARWLKTQRQQYRDSGCTRDLLGRERYGLMTGNEPVNTPIQGTAARLVLDGQNELHQLSRELQDPHLLPLINIHDDICWALPDANELITVYVEEISKILTKVRYKWQIVPLMIEWRIGTNWADLEPVYEHTGDYVR